MLFSGYSGPREDLVWARVGPEGGLRVMGGLRQGGNPSFACRLGDAVYTVSERPDGAEVTSYALAGDGLERTGSLALPGMRGLCHLAAAQGKLYGSCYESGHFFALDAGLSRVLWTFLPPGTPRAHWTQEAQGRLCLADLGNSRVYRFALEDGLPSGESQTLSLPAGSGPRQPLALDGGLLAVVCELDGMLRFYREDAACVFELPASQIPGPNAPGGACRMGDVLLVGNRGPDTVSALRMTPQGPQRLGEWPTGHWPRHLACVGEWVFVACDRGGEVWQYRWDGAGLKRLAVLPLPGAACSLMLD